MAKVIGLRNAGVAGVNPKDKIGATKIDLTVVSPIAIAHCAFAMMDGADKYGEYNWRVEPILARTYVAAAMRHLQDWLDGEEEAGDSLAHHLSHAMACCAILIDAQHQGSLVDDRLIQREGGDTVSQVFEMLNVKLKARNEMRASKPIQHVDALVTHRVKPGDELVLDPVAFLGGRPSDHMIDAARFEAEMAQPLDSDSEGLLKSVQDYHDRLESPAGQQEHQEVLDALKDC